MEADRVFQNSDEQSDEEPIAPKRKRGKGGKEFISSLRDRKVFDNRQLQQLQGKLETWFTRTNMPTVALSLSKDRNGDVAVEFSGAKWFRDFIKDPYIANKFIEVSINGLQTYSEKENANENENETENEHPELAESEPEADLDPDLIKRLLNDDVLMYDAHEKSKLLGSIINRKGLTSRTCWLPDNKPVWWPELPFRSPNSGPSRMKCAEMDLILQACIDQLQRGKGRINRPDSIQVNSPGMPAAERAAERDLALRSSHRQTASQSSFVIIERKIEAPGQPTAEQHSTSQNAAHTRYIAIKRITESYSWNKEEAGAFLDYMVDDLEFLEMAVHLIPKRIQMNASDFDTLNCYTHYGLRYQLPESCDSLDAFVVTQNGNGMFRAVSVTLYGATSYWPVIRLLCVKFGFERFDYVMQQLKDICKTDKEIIRRIRTRGCKVDVNTCLKEELLFMLLPNHKCSVSVKCYSVSAEHHITVPCEGCMNEVVLLWEVDGHGDATDCVFPLLARRTGEDENGVCGAGYCCVINTSVQLKSTTKLKCQYCLRSFHQNCLGVGKILVEMENWCCGCNVFHSDINIIECFSGKETISRLLQTYSTDIQRHVTAVLRGTVYCWRLEMAKTLEEDQLITDLRFDESWLFGMNGVGVSDISHYVSRLASAVKQFMRIEVERKGLVVRFGLLPEVISFLIHRKSKISLFCARNLLEFGKRHKLM